MAKRLYVGQLITELGPGPAERTVYELSRRLNPEQFDVEVIALQGGELVEQFRQADIPLRVLDVRGRWDFHKLRGVSKLLGQKQFDILHTHMFQGDMAGRLSRTKDTRHLLHSLYTIESSPRPYEFAFARLTANVCDRIVAVSEAVATSNGFFLVQFQPKRYDSRSETDFAEVRTVNKKPN